ncbi:MAG: FadR/GntR family transcriptional regulator, partial [Egibacteraceae bacterium]
MASEPAWQPVQRIRTHEQVLAQIEERILRGHLRVGDRLPSERELSETLGVSRASVREALRVLESMGIIEANVGSGRDAGSIVSGRSTAALSNLLRLHMALSQFQLKDLVDIRVQLERWASERAAALATDEDIRQLRALVAAMDSDELDYVEFNELDTEFHITIAKAARNAPLSDLMQALRDAVKTEMTSAFERLPDWRHTARQLTTEHARIVDAIENHDDS